MDLNNLDTISIAECSQKECISAEDNIIQRLQRRQLRLTSELKDVQEALAALESNPEIAKVLVLISKVGR